MMCASPITLNKYNIEVPCGRCIACKLAYAKEWTTRQYMEMQYHLPCPTFFVTLTYSDECDYIQSSKLDFAKRYPSSPVFYSLSKNHARNFVRRLRYEFLNFRYVLIGEYGETTFRPHYHLTIYGIDFDDLKLYKDTKFGSLYTSKTLEGIWGFGHCPLSIANKQTFGYIARYRMSKNHSLAYCKNIGCKYSTYLDFSQSSLSSSAAGEHLTAKKVKCSGILPFSFYDIYGLERPFKRSSVNPSIGDMYIASADDPLSVKSVVYNGIDNSLPRRYVASIGIKQYRKNYDEETARLNALGIQDILGNNKRLYDQLKDRTKVLKRGGDFMT